MDFFTIFIIAISIGIIGGIISAVNKSKNIKQSALSINSIVDFNPSQSFIAPLSIAIDEQQKKICFMRFDKTPFLYSFSDILQSELVIDGEVISKHSVSSTVGRAIVGGVLGGGIGAIIGGVTSSSKQKQEVQKIQVKITINDTSNPIWTVDFLDIKTKKNSFIYKPAFSNAEKWQGIITIILKQNENSTVQPALLTSSLTDELLKLAELKDKGILTELEFNTQKTRLLS